MFNMDDQQGPIVSHMELCSVTCDSLDGSGVLVGAGIDTCSCLAESPHCSPETTTSLLISYIPMQNVFGVKKLKFLKRDLMETSITTYTQILLELDSREVK